MLIGCEANVLSTPLAKKAGIAMLKNDPYFISASILEMFLVKLELLH